MEMAPAVFQFTVDNLKMKISSCHTILQVIFLSFFLFFYLIHFQDDDNDYLEPATAQWAKMRKIPMNTFINIHFGTVCLDNYYFFKYSGATWKISKNVDILAFETNCALSCQKGPFISISVHSEYADCKTSIGKNHIDFSLWGRQCDS